MGAVLDTSVLVDLERQARDTSTSLGRLLGDRLEAALGPEEEIAIAAITASELLHGVHRADKHHRPRREAFVEGLLAALPTIPFDLRAARIHAGLWANLTSSGIDVGAHDRLIAATAISLGWRIVTANARHFNRISGVDVAELSTRS